MNRTSSIPILRGGKVKYSEKYGEKGRNPYDGLRIWSALTHGLGAALAVAGLVLLLVHGARLGSGVHVVCFAIYGAALVLLYTFSTLYHSVRVGVKGRILLRKLDHSCIYLLIAGTYMPVCLLPLRGALGWSLFGVIWGMAALGCVLAAVWINAPRWLTAAIYLVMGWAVIVAIWPLYQALSVSAFVWLVSGGVLYTVGGVLYALKWPGRGNKYFGCHEIFHVFILLGSLCHWAMMWQL